MLSRTTNIAVFVSGGGTNLQALIDAQNSGIISSGAIRLVVASRNDAYALQRAERTGIPNTAVQRNDYKSQNEYEEALSKVLKQYDIDMIVLAGFLSILSGNFTKQFPDRIINVHPSLIPSFCGKGYYGLKVHEKALAYGVKVTGATVHYVNEVPDGGKIIYQKAVDILPGDTPEKLQRRVMEQAEWVLLPKAAELVSKRIAKEKDTMSIYDVKTMGETIKGNPYVGRGLVVGKTADGTRAAIAYFIMGRSENSRNRVFRENGQDVTIFPYDESKVEDPSLIIYSPIKPMGKATIVTNGDQTQTIYDYMTAGKTFEEALDTRCFEPDGPNFTPRISAIVCNGDHGFRYKLNILKSGDAAGTVCNRYTFKYEPVNGLGHFIHTYVTDGNPIPTFQGEPERVSVPNDIDEFFTDIWDNLDENNRISLYVRYISLADGKTENRMVNKNR